MPVLGFYPSMIVARNSRSTGFARNCRRLVCVGGTVLETFHRRKADAAGNSLERDLPFLFRCRQKLETRFRSQQEHIFSLRVFRPPPSFKHRPWRPDHPHSNREPHPPTPGNPGPRSFRSPLNPGNPRLLPPVLPNDSFMFTGLRPFQPLLNPRNPCTLVPLNGGCFMFSSSCVAQETDVIIIGTRCGGGRAQLRPWADYHNVEGG